MSDERVKVLVTWSHKDRGTPREYHQMFTADDFWADVYDSSHRLNDFRRAALAWDHIWEPGDRLETISLYYTETDFFYCLTKAELNEKGMPVR